MSTDRAAWTGQDLISIRDLSREDIETVLDEARRIATDPDLLRSVIIASLFFEPSTRTQLSFSTAALRLGARLIGFASGEATSKSKGETLADTVRMAEAYADLIIIRHPLEGSARLAADTTDIPVVNAGDGANQHPTQTLLDLFMIQQSLGRIDGLKIGMVGDLRYGRTVHSLAQALTRFDDVSLRLMSPPTLQIPDAVRRELDGELAFEEIDDLAVEDLDVVYVTRIQRERFPDVEEYDKVQGTYVMTPETADAMREDAIILHPLPRVDEIEPAVDDKPQAKYFEQARGGVPVRMALLKLLLRGPNGGQS